VLTVVPYRLSHPHIHRGYAQHSRRLVAVQMTIVVVAVNVAIFLRIFLMRWLHYGLQSSTAIVVSTVPRVVWHIARSRALVVIREDLGCRIAVSTNHMASPCVVFQLVGSLVGVVYQSGLYLAIVYTVHARHSSYWPLTLCIVRIYAPYGLSFSSTCNLSTSLFAYCQSHSRLHCGIVQCTR